jgi:transaldolase
LPATINTLPEKTLLAFADHGHPQPVLRDGAEAFVKSWRQLLQRIADKSAGLGATL